MHSFKAHLLDRSRAEEELLRQQKENNLMNAFNAGVGLQIMPPPPPTTNSPLYQRHVSSPFAAQQGGHLAKGVLNVPNAVHQQQYHQEQIAKSRHQFLNPANLTATNEMNAVGTPMSSPSSAMPPPPCPSPNQIYASSQSHNFMGHEDISTRTATPTATDGEFYSAAGVKNSYQKPHIPTHQIPVDLGAMPSPPLHNFASHQSGEFYLKLKSKSKLFWNFYKNLNNLSSFKCCKM